MTRAPTHRDDADVIVIGAGSGGLTVAVGLSRLGRRVVLVEANDVGGDCTNVGCIPSKSLLHHSSLGGSARDTLATVRRRRTALRDRETEEFGSLDGIDLQFGRAFIEAPGRVAITQPGGATSVLEADHVVVATGSRPRRLPIAGAPGGLVITNEELFEFDDAPRHLVVVGGGPIGLEMAVAFARLGSRITVIEAAPQILPSMLPEAADVVRRSLERQRIDIRTGSVAHRYGPGVASAASIQMQSRGGTVGGGGGSLQIGPREGGVVDVVGDVDRILMAVGRVPNSGDLGLAEVGVRLDATEHIVVDSKGRTSVPGIWACGDVSDRGGTTHAAGAWGRRVIKHIIAPLAPAGRAPEISAVAFTDPEAATIGDQPQHVPADVRRLQISFADVDRGYTDEIVDGMVIVDVRRFSGRVLGATVVGPRAGELISVFALAMKNDLAFHRWYGTVWPYPTYAGALGDLVDEYMSETVVALPGELKVWMRGRLGRATGPPGPVARRR